MQPQAGQLESLIETDPFADVQVPEALLESLARHRRHLAKLVVSLQSVGISEEQIENSVSVMVASYKEELMHAIRLMMEVPRG